MGRNIIVPLRYPIIPLNCMQFQSLHPEQKRPRGIIRGLEQLLREEKLNRILSLENTHLRKEMAEILKS